MFGDHDSHVLMALFRLGQSGMPAPFADVAPAVTTWVCMIQKDLCGNDLTKNLITCCTSTMLICSSLNVKTRLRNRLMGDELLI